MPDHYRGCPYFGLPSDPDTRIMFPMEGGVCHRAEPAGRVEISYQQTTCLSAQHQSCPVFLRHHKAPLPPEISGVEIKRSGSRRVLLGVLVIFLFAIVGVFIGLWWANSDADLEALIPTDEGGSTAVVEPALVVATETATSVLAVRPVEPTAVPTQPVEPTTVPSPTPLPTDTPTPPLPPTFTPLVPTPLPPATETPLPGATVVVDVVRLNVRLGPNTAYETTGLIDEGTEYEIVGRLNDNTWLQICCVAGQPGWVFAEAVLVEGSLDAVPVIVEFPPLPESEP